MDWPRCSCRRKAWWLGCGGCLAHRGLGCWRPKGDLGTAVWGSRVLETSISCTNTRKTLNEATLTNGRPSLPLGVSSSYSSKSCSFLSIFSSTILSCLDSTKLPYKGLLQLSPSGLISCMETSDCLLLRASSAVPTHQQEAPTSEGQQIMYSLASVHFQAQPRLVAVTCQVLACPRNFTFGSHGLKQASWSFVSAWLFTMLWLPALAPPPRLTMRITCL